MRYVRGMLVALALAACATAACAQRLCVDPFVPDSVVPGEDVDAECRPHTGRWVATRPQPRLSARSCPGAVRRGNDGQTWRSDGVHWHRVQAQPTRPPPRPTSKPGTPGKPIPVGCKVWGDALAPGVDVPGGVSRSNVRATYHLYSPEYAVSTTACADRIRAMWGPATWSQPMGNIPTLKYPWTAACLPGLATPAACGTCLRVTNKNTGAAVTVRVVDRGGCSDADGTGLDLDTCAFDAIDTDRRGYADGHMRVDVRQVQC
jgi:hypothetical protein